MCVLDSINIIDGNIKNVSTWKEQLGPGGMMLLQPDRSEGVRVAELVVRAKRVGILIGQRSRTARLTADLTVMLQS